jgi:hypothetical protein
MERTEFFRKQVDRFLKLAQASSDPAIRAELEKMADEYRAMMTGKGSNDDKAEPATPKKWSAGLPGGSGYTRGMTSFDRAQALTELLERNQLRRDLPALDLDSEIRRLEQVHEETSFERFLVSSRLYWRAIRRGRYRYTKRKGGNSHFSTAGQELESCVRRGMRKRFDRTITKEVN